MEHYEVGGVRNATSWPYKIYKSVPFNPPVWEINATGDPLAPGLVFTTPSDTFLPVVKQAAPQITTDKGDLVWFGPTSNATNFKWQTLNGEPTLTYWSGDTTDSTNIGHGYGNITMLSSSYEEVTVLCPHFGLNVAGGGPHSCEADIHESFITDRNTILISAYNATPADLTVIGGPSAGWIWDSQFYEVDPSTGQVLFRWSSFEHVDVNGTEVALGNSGNSTAPFDYFHINSVVNVGDHYLLNSRLFSTVYYIDNAGNIEWQFSGTDGGDFGPLPTNGSFKGEHYVRPHNVTNTTLDISFFNNNNNDFTGHNPSSLVRYRLPRSKGTGMKAQLLSNLTTDPLLFDLSQGSYTPFLPNGNQFADYGQLPIMKEFSPLSEGSKEIWSARLGPDNLIQLYRGYKQEWHATPHTQPDLVVEAAGANHTTGAGYVSWNGATDVMGWNVYVGESEQAIKHVGQVSFRGFETKFDVVCWARYVQVGAVVNGTEVRRSEVVALKEPAWYA